MKILFLAENFPPEVNAAATRVFERACYWVAAGHEVTVITCAPNFPQGKLYPGYRNRWYQTEEMDGIRVVRVKTFIARNEGVLRRGLDFLSFMVTATAAGLFQRRPEVVAATSPQFFAAVGGWAIGALRRIPFVFELGDLWPASITAVGAMRRGRLIALFERVEMFLYRRAAAIVALTPAFKENLVRRGVPADKIAVVINGVDLARYAPRGRDAALAREWDLEDRFVVGYVGTHGMAHALGNVLDCAARLAGEKEIRFLLVGDGAARAELIAEAARRGLGNVTFAPPQPKDAMSRVWSLCDVALVHLKNAPLFATVMPSKIFEAMAMGVPVLLAAPEGEASRLIAESGGGVAVPAEDVGALGDAVLRLWRDADERRRLAENALVAAPRFSRERQAAHMIAVLAMAATGEGASASRARG